MLLRPWIEVHRFGNRCLIHVREAFDRGDQARDAHRGVLNLRCEAADRTSGCGPPQHGVQRRPIDGSGQQIERLERHGGVRQRFRDGDVEAVIGEPVGDGLLAFGLLDGRPHAVHAAWPRRTRERRRRRRVGRRSAWHAPSARVARSASSSRSSSSAALRSIADAGLFSSCASPADNFPRETIFSSCRSLEVKARARSTMVWTRIDVTSWHSRIIARRWSRCTARIVVGSWATESPGGPDQAGVREQARNVAFPPFHDLVRPSAAVDEHGDAPRQHDEQAFHPRALRGQHVAGVQLSKGPVRRPATPVPREAPRRASCAPPADRRDPLSSSPRRSE